VTLAGKKILLIIGGGIAAYKSLELVRLLRRAGISINAILTEAGKNFVTPLSLQALTESPVHTDLFSLTAEQEMGHIALSRTADLVVVAPATADILAKLAAGLAPDLASTVLLATDKPVLVAPAMNVRMWRHQATETNMATLAARGVTVIGPNEGEMACHEYGPGRMAEPQEIFDAIAAFFAPGKQHPLTGKHILVTAGPTHEPIDPVRVIANRSSGKQGFAIAAALAALGARISLISGPVALADPPGCDVIRIDTAQQMRDAVFAALPADAAICAAAVADWGVTPTPQKLKKTDGPPDLKFFKNPDILAELAQSTAQRPRLVIGFAAETNDVLAEAHAKLLRKKCDWIIANDVSQNTGIMGGDHNRVHIFDAQGRDDWPDLPKDEVAARLARRIADFFDLD
jgi:phosphopantothenoylcysteine decarboxylase/phosphopantothenate--cysteine ligase